MRQLKPCAVSLGAFFSLSSRSGSFPPGQEGSRGLLEDIQHAVHWITGEPGGKG